MPAIGNAVPRTSNYTINNVAPTVTFAAGDMWDGAPLNLNIRGAGDKRAWATSTDVVDNNGCDDIVSATSTMYVATSTYENLCAANENSCYQIPAIQCTISDCPVGGDTDAIATVSCYADFKYFAQPTDTGTYAATNWLTAIKAFDESLAGTGTTSAVVGKDIIGGIGLEISQTTIPYNTIVAGQNTGDYNATTTVINYANSPLDNNVAGYEMIRNAVGPERIPTEEQIFDIVNFSYPGATYSLSSTTPQLVDVVVDRPTFESDSFADDIYWGIAVPSGLLSGDYVGSTTFTAVQDIDGNWN